MELAPKHIVSTTTYNGQFPGPLLRFQEGKPVTIDIHNQTDTPEQLHWHGQFVSTDVDGAAEEGTPFIPPHGSRRITFVPKPSGYRFYHTHVRARANLNAGQYTGLVGPVYIEPKNNPGNYDREVFLTLKEFEPTYSRGGDMDMDFLVARCHGQGAERFGRERHESLARQRHAAWIRGRVWLLHHQRTNAGQRRTDTGEAGRTRALPRPERERDRDPQSGVARTYLHGGCDGWQPNPQAGERAGTLARHSRANLSNCRNESPRHLDHGRYGER